jgi:N-acetylglucosaminyldiphosphoundecaprenol N-acetyl-beta-D-mannosaminyltransferase
MKPEIFGVPLDPLTKEESLGRIARSIEEKSHLWIATVNTEWLMRTRHDEVFKSQLLRADLRVADGSGVLWAATFLALPWRGSLWSLWQLLYSGASLVFYPKFCRKILPDLIPGSWLTIKLAEEAEEKGWRIFLLGAAPGVADRVAQRWQEKYPRLAVATSAADPDDAEVQKEIAAFGPQIILVAYSAPEQLSWLEGHLTLLPPAVGIGVGGSLDYLAGKVPKPPRIINALGLEWLWRLVTQPWRWRRVVNAVPIFMKNVVQYRSSLNTK